jgi:hypothetical protein
MTEKRKIQSTSWELFQKEQEQQNPQSPNPVAIDINAQSAEAIPTITAAEILDKPLPTPISEEMEQTGMEKDVRQKKSINIGQDKSKDKNFMRICLIVFIIAVAGSCAGLFVKFSADKAFVRQELASMAQSNQEAFDDINARLSSMEEQMKEISLVLAEADQSISSSSSANRQAMAQKIEELNKQLASLKKSLELLKESKGNI